MCVLMIAACRSSQNRRVSVSSAAFPTAIEIQSSAQSARTWYGDYLFVHNFANFWAICTYLYFHLSCYIDVVILLRRFVHCLFTSRCPVTARPKWPRIRLRIQSASFRSRFCESFNCRTRQLRYTGSMSL